MELKLKQNLADKRLTGKEIKKVLQLHPGSILIRIDSLKNQQIISDMEEIIVSQKDNFYSLPFYYFK